ncbi:alpha/beta fold hydrolase [Roseibacterium sp. SDUM158016]|uniref:alpha/beta fold hydrolase n=1 Tax=Roseicyclus sediminis TaxID=2980997 RepID=UPI0021D026FC|nr:alpha/beta hydrolase [Roseibacterium sp. SDUM158016]MCU4652720.1 alpha/beta fold hydrolase [Roseibacterium sp. SDUM158016]
MARVEANGIMLEVECHGDPHAVPIVLIRGLGSQLIQWPDRLIGDLLAAGLQVVTFDNRDAGLSQKFEGAPAYTLTDMAADTVGVMDALGIGRAHVLGMSMGGTILQIMALEHPARLLSGIAVMSSSRAPYLPKARPEVQAALLSSAPSGRREDVVAHGLSTGRLWQSPRWPFDTAGRAALIGRLWDRCYCPEGVSRQYGAMVASEPDLARIDAIRTPLLVIHGTEDTLLPPEHGRDIARRVPGARLVEIEGMGHDLEGDLPGLVADHAVRFIETVSRGGKTHNE